MSDESLGKARLDLTVDTLGFRKNVDEAEKSGDSLKRNLEAIVAAGEAAERALGQVKMEHGTESRASAEEIISGVRGIGEESVAAARELDRVKITETQATESVAAGERIKANVDDIGDQADSTKRKLEEVSLANKTIGGTSLSLLGIGISAGALLAPSAAPAMLGLLAAIPALALTGAGALGTLLLAFRGVGSAIGGNKKAFDALEPAQQKFVLDIRSLDGELDHLSQIAGQQLFPALDKGLHAFLSAGTLQMITQAVSAFSHAIGQAGEQWGRYFGSAEFQQTMGPLLQAGAHWFGQFSTVALSLSDTLLTLMRAAIPFTNWLGDVSVQGAKWIDTLVRGRDATGQLTGAFHDAQTSLTLLGHLIESLGRVLGALGAALYPVSNVAVKDLTDGLNWLAHVINDNQTEIRNIVSGALSALKTAIHILEPVIADLARGIEVVTGKIGGWKTVFLALLALKLVATFVGWINKVADFGAAAKLAASRVGLIGPAAAASAAEADTALAGIGTAAAAAEVSVRSLLGALSLIAAVPLALSMIPGKGSYHTGGALPGSDSDQSFKYGAHTISLKNGQWTMSTVAAGSKGGYTTVDVPISAAQAAKYAKQAGYSGVTYNVGTDGPSSRGASALRSLSLAHQHVKHSQTPSSSLFGTVPPWTTTGGSGSGSGAGSRTPTQSSLVGDSLLASIQHAKDMAAQSQGAVAEEWLKTERQLLELAKRKATADLKGASPKQKTAIDAELRNINGQITSVNVQIAANLKAQAAAVKQSFQSKLSSEKSAIGSAMDQVKSALDTQFEQATQNYIDTVLAAKFSQGTDPNTGAARLTPLEQQLADMQAQDQLSSLQDSLSQAQASGDPTQVAAAQRALDEYNLQIEATQQRQQADADYAKAVQQYQDQRTAAEKQMNSDLDALSAGLQNGTAKLSDLNGIAATFGVTLTDQTSGAADSMGILDTATQSLAKTMLKEALALTAVGDTKDAKTIKAAIAAIGSLPTSTSSGAGGGLPVVPMAAGGVGRITMPTLFYSKGNEDYAFSGEGRSFAPRSDDDLRHLIEVPVYLNDREIARAMGNGLNNDRHATRLVAKAIKPALARVIAIPIRPAAT